MTAKTGQEKNWQLAGSSWAGAWKVSAGVGVVGLIGAGIGFTIDHRRFAFSWLFAFITVLMISLGAIFFTLIQRLTAAHWSVTVRRTAEFFGLGIIPLVFLFVPVLVSMNDLFPWLHAEHGEKHAGIALVADANAQEHAPGGPHAPGHGNPPPSDVGDPAGKLPGAHGGVPSDHPVMGDHGEHGAAAEHGAGHGAHAFGPMGDPHEVIEKDLIRKKSGYLNKNFFLIRVAIYFVIWLALALRLFKFSTAQDKSKDVQHTLSAQGFAPAGTMLFALSLTFAVFDWVMSLEPTWFSTIFGVIMFSTGVVSSLALMILVTLSLRASGPLEGAVTVEHFHDLGKLMFGFLVFWAYVQFSQFMLIWYAALPEETTFFHNRWDHEPWHNVSMALLLFHFVVPFFWTMSRNFKRNTSRLRISAAILLVMHAVDIYWFVMPNFKLGQEGFAFHWLDVACLLAVSGIWGAYVFYRMTQHPLVPVGDPRLRRSLEFMNA